MTLCRIVLDKLPNNTGSDTNGCKISVSASRLKYLSKMNPKFVKQLKGWLDDGTGRSIAKRQYDGMILFQNVFHFTIQLQSEL